MSQSIKAIRTDDRSRHEQQAYDVTYGGKSRETGADGYTSRLSATYMANFQLTIPVDTVGRFTYILPSYVYANSYLVVEGSGGAPVANMRIEGLDGTNNTVLAAALALDAPSGTAVPFDTGGLIEARNVDQRVVINVTAVGTGYATVIIPAVIIQTGWK